MIFFHKNKKKYETMKGEDHVPCSIEIFHHHQIPKLEHQQDLVE